LRKPHGLIREMQRLCSPLAVWRLPRPVEAATEAVRST
jgi:hypothetical protein